MASFETICHKTQICVVGGGIAGMCAAISAARHGIRVVLMQDRPVLGGNASSEIRMWISGAHGSQLEETGIVEELKLENLYRNPDMNYSVWDGILYESVREEPGIELLLNCSCLDAEMKDGRIVNVTGWQLTTQTYHKVEAALFIDCSGDSVLAPLSGAEYRLGREGRGGFDEDIAPETPDKKTMGLSCMIQVRQERTPNVFIPPKSAYKITEEDLIHRMPDLTRITENFWYLELGGEYDSIHDTEWLRDELLKTAYGLWDYLKNDPSQREKNTYWHLDWVGMLPGKRESRRYVGDHILTQNDVRAEGRFDDVVAYGGWSMDDHHPAGFRTKEPPNIFHPAPSPYGIPYRCLYSRNVPNLLFAGRNISVTHTAMSSTRVMGTCALLGQAAGTAASLAVRYDTTPRGVYERHIDRLQRLLMDDDCFLPFRTRPVSETTCAAQITLVQKDGAVSDASVLKNGVDRPDKTGYNGCRLSEGDSILIRFPKETPISRVRIVYDSDLDRETEPEPLHELCRNMIHNRPLDLPEAIVPKTLPRVYEVVGVKSDGTETVLVREENAHQRLCVHAVNGIFTAVRLTVERGRGDPTGVFAFEVDE